MALRISTDLKNFLCNTGVITQLAGTTGTAGTACIYFYNGTQAGNADNGTAGTLSGTFGSCLCIISGVAWSAGTSGTAYLASSSYAGTAVGTGTASWARAECVNANGTCRIDGDVGTSSANVFAINVSSLTAGGVVTLVSADIYMA
jgi:hypothetical protein